MIWRLRPGESRSLRLQQSDLVGPQIHESSPAGTLMFRSVVATLFASFSSLPLSQYKTVPFGTEAIVDAGA